MGAIMLTRTKDASVRFLRWSERYTKTDMVYLVSSSFWIQASSVSISLASFLLYILFGHVLPKDVYGTYQYLLSLSAIVGAFTLTGMSNAVGRAVARGFEGSYRQSIRIQLIWGLVPLVGAVVAGSYYLAHGNTTLGWGLLLVGIFVPLSTTYNTYGSYLNAKKDFQGGFLYGLIVAAPYYIAIALVAYSLRAALALLAANLISQTLGYFVAHRALLKKYQPNEFRDPEAMRYGAHLSIINFLGTVVGQADSVLVFHFLGATELAIYSFATAIPDRLGIFKNIAAAAFPKYATKTTAEVRTSLGPKLFIGIFVALSIAAVYWLLAPIFFHLFFPLYFEAVSYSRLYALMIAASFGAIFSSALTAHGRVKALYAYNIISPLVQLSFEVVGILMWGLWGLIIARLVAAVLSSLFNIGLFLFI
jgi:O-antigen/teichoic acid export membrane protein